MAAGFQEAASPSDGLSAQSVSSSEPLIPKILWTDELPEVLLGTIAHSAGTFADGNLGLLHW